ncbi:MAG: putative symporter YjmB [candidate division WS2 bacterium]|nr:putative symporter YjmB [Candidatus Psychracetigena formicireducens]MBT9150353.1 putative symporter YjmB [Candidatus Psychracetigena formicireducens]
MTTLKKVAYSVGSLGASLPTQTFNTYVIFFYVDHLKLPASWVALLWLFYGIWNAINDPLFGYFSDRTKSRLGRRIPYIIFGTIPLALVFFLIWSPPSTLTTNISLFIYLTGIVFLFDTFYTLVILNWTALYPEMYTTLKERTFVSVLRQIFGMVGIIGGIALAPLVYGSLGWKGMGILFSAITAVSIFISLAGSKENKEIKREPLNILPALKFTLFNNSFITYVLYSLLVQFTFVLIMATTPFYVKYALKLGEVENSLLLLSCFLVAFLSFFPWSKVTNRYGARFVAAASTISFAISLIFTYFVSSLYAGIIAFAFIGIGLGGIIIILDVLLAQIVDEDRLKTGVRREGMYFGANALFIRLGISLQGLILGLVLSRTGYNPELTVQPFLAITGIRLLMSAIPIIALLISLFFIYRYPLHGEKLKTLERQLKEEELVIEVK